MSKSDLEKFLIKIDQLNLIVKLIEKDMSKKEALSRVWGHSVFFGLKLFYFVYHATKSIRSINTQKSRDSSKNNIKVQKTLLDSTTVGIDEKRVHFNEIQSQYIQRAICDYCYRRREQMDSLKFYKKRDQIKMISQKEVLIFQVNGPMDTKENRQCRRPVQQRQGILSFATFRQRPGARTKNKKWGNLHGC